VTHHIGKRHLATASGRDTLENLLQSRLIRIGDQAAPKVFLQGLMCASSALPQYAMGVVGNVFDLNTGHGAILALLAPLCKYARVASAAAWPQRIYR
jgi:hypothetical protein